MGPSSIAWDEMRAGFGMLVLLLQPVLGFPLKLQLRAQQEQLRGILPHRTPKTRQRS